MLWARKLLPSYPRGTCRFNKRSAAADGCHRLIRQRDRGQAVVETALIMMLFVSLLFLVFDFGIVLNDWISATTAGSVGARHLSVGACLEGSAPDPSICATGETSVVGAVMESAPLMSTGVNCQYPAPSAQSRCFSRVDIGIENLTGGGGMYCRDAELWLDSQSAVTGSSSTVILTSGTNWAANALVGGRLAFTGGANVDTSRTITANTATSITVTPAFSSPPAQVAPLDPFNVATLHTLPITSGWLSCSSTALVPEINDTLTVVVRAQVDVPVALPGLPSQFEVATSSTVRYEGDFVQ